MKRKRKWNNITHATHLKFKASEVQFTVTAPQIQNVLNENLSQSGSGLAKIGTEWGSGEGHFGKTSLTASSSHRSPSPFQRLIHPKDLGGVVCLVRVYIMTWGCNMSAIMASDSPEDFPFLKLRFRPSFFPGSHHVPWQHNYSKCLWKHSQHQVPCFKQQKLKTWKIPQSSRTRTTSTFLHDVSLRSVSNSKFWMPSRTLLSLSSLRDIWQQNEPQTKTKNQYADKIVSTASIRVSHPLLNSSLVPVLNHIVLSENNKWTSSWQNQLFSCRYTRRIPVPLALCLGIDIRGIPCGIPASPESAYTREGRTLPSPSKDRDVVWVKQIWYAPWLPRSPEKVVIWCLSPQEPGDSSLGLRPSLPGYNPRTSPSATSAVLGSQVLVALLWRRELPWAQTRARCRRHRCQWWTALWHARMSQGGCGGSYAGAASGGGVPFSILSATSFLFSCSLSIDSWSWVITSCKDWSRSMRPFLLSLSTSFIETSSDHSRCFFNLLNSPTTAPTLLVLWFTPAANDSDARAMLLTASPTISRLRQRSCWRVCVLLMRVSSLSVDPFSAATIEVIPTARSVVELNRSVASPWSSGPCILNLGDLDLSSSLPASPSSLSSLSSPCIRAVSCSFSFSESVSALPACAVNGGFSDKGSSPSAVGTAGAAGAGTFAAMNHSSLLDKAWCTRWDKPGPKYSLGIICNQTRQSL